MILLEVEKSERPKPRKKRKAKEDASNLRDSTPNETVESNDER